jgi:hypothetical protein
MCDENWKNRDGWERERGEAELTVIARHCSSFPNECSTRQHRPEWEEQINEFFFEKTLGKHSQQWPKRKKQGKMWDWRGAHRRAREELYQDLPPPPPLGLTLPGGMALQTRLRSASQRTGREPAGARGEKGMQTMHPA